MKWLIPAKTFLVGEYIALAGGPAIILTTRPAFEVTWSLSTTALPFHKESPAGKFCHQVELTSQLAWHDPYQGLGGMGASSAQFVGAYWAYCFQQQISFSHEDMLQTYFQVAWSGEGERPSGYDVLAQTLNGCVLVDQKKSQLKSVPWPFDDIAFILIHTGQKLATHEHLKQALMAAKYNPDLLNAARSAWSAFATKNEEGLTDAVNLYYGLLLALNLVADHTQMHIQRLLKYVRPLAIKGCGALGADVILMLVEQKSLDTILQQLVNLKEHVIATSNEIA